ncbi:MAG: carbamoyltransferase HypF [Chloroflexi bacterium]|nr:carbamoyltransferase HypF [Chloroflexota bacterium]
MNLEFSGLKINITGIVQGVGFRPFVYNLAIKHHLSGSVLNNSNGVEIEVYGQEQQLNDFFRILQNQPPPLSKIDRIQSNRIPYRDATKFIILESSSNQEEFLPISPDISICPDCRKELFDPLNRRYRYPFINCTNCGPRFSIIKNIPYDRPLTTMAPFQMCSDCKSEYETPSDRRFHAQPIACNKCGPRLSFRSPNGSVEKDEKALQTARSLIKQGLIIGIKGIGGYHLVCDGRNSSTINQLRMRKKRSDRPFALMAFDSDAILNYCEINAVELHELNSPQHPIVLLNKAKNCSLPEEIAPNQNYLGFLLPYTPLHYLLIEPEKGFPDILVMTSGNLNEEPIAYLDEDAFSRLSPLVDGFLTNDRQIHMRVDDSVVRVVSNHPLLIRRSRGYAPQPILMKDELPEILACGAELKNTFCLSRSNYAFTSHHIGDLVNFETLDSYEKSILHYQKLFRISPKFIVCDLHPDYQSTKYAKDRSSNEQIPLIQVQHHHAHLASCLVDHQCASDENVVGLIFDGTGYGTDGKIWGGEVLIGSIRNFQRRFHLSETPLPGGDIAIRNPARIALSYLYQANIAWSSNLPPVRAISIPEQRIIQSQIDNRINTPYTTSMGRLFDAVSSLIGIRHIATYEGQAAIELENQYDETESGVYDLPIESGIIQIVPLLKQITSDLEMGVSKSVISSKFHNGIARMCLSACEIIRRESSIQTVALSGGVWQNHTLLRITSALLQNQNFTVLVHDQIPANDGGISVGQLMASAELLR